ncbi:toll-like receptor 6 [Lineus longissimus]|uniref:toll-like receptor 6 n=1 Tax=Lineus longissimus TaxID=88925 RepID=UPI00315D565A
MGAISLALFVAATALLFSRDATQYPSDLQTKETLPADASIHPACKVSIHHHDDTKCVKRVTCKWIMGKDFPAIAKKVGEQNVDSLHIQECHLPLAHQNEINFSGNYTSYALQYLDNLIGLHIEGCKVTGIEQNTFDSMTQLRWLSLINATLPELPSKVFGKLRDLEKLDLSRNELGDLSLQIESTKLDWLILRGCSLDDLNIVSTTRERLNLTVLDITDNHLTEIAGLAQLLGCNASLYLDHNPYAFHRKMFGEGCNGLSSLSVSVQTQRDIDKLGAALSNIRVHSLSIFNASTSNDIDIQDFRKNFQFNELTHIQIDALEIYDFSNWWLNTLTPEGKVISPENPFERLKRVKALRLRSCANPGYYHYQYVAMYPQRDFPNYMKALETISLNHADLDSFKIFYPTKVTTLDLSFGTSSQLVHNHTDPSTSIKALNFSSCNVEVRLIITSSRASLIEELILRNMTLATNIVRQNITIWLAPLPSLRHLDLSANSDSYYPHIPFFTWIVNVREAFTGLENLEQLELNDTDIGAVDIEDLKYMLRPLKSLKRLDLDKSRFSHIPEDTFLNQVNLEELHLADNEIRVIGHSAFRTLVRLKYLDLRNNRIEFIHGEAMGHLTSLMHGTFLFTENNFGCHCDLAGFTKWLKEHTFPHENRCEWRSERCTVPLHLKDTPILDYQPGWTDCDNNLLILTVSSIFSVFLILSSSIAIHSYRRRLSIRYWYVLQKLRRARSRARNTEGGTQNVSLDEPFDVFISFELNDRYWVEETLLPNLEHSDDIRFRVCTVDRDLNDPGRPEVMNIARGIRNSRNVIFVVTREFAQTSWCEYEISLAETQYLQEGNCRLVVLFLQKFTWEELPLCLKRLLSHVNFLRWPATAHERNEFWQRLRLMLLGEATQSLTRVLYTRY